MFVREAIPKATTFTLAEPLAIPFAVAHTTYTAVDIHGDGIEHKARRPDGYQPVEGLCRKDTLVGTLPGLEDALLEFSRTAPGAALLAERDFHARELRRHFDMSSMADMYLRGREGLKHFRLDTEAISLLQAAAKTAKEIRARHP